MAVPYKPPIRFHDWHQPTREEPWPPPPTRMEDWVPSRKEIPAGPSPQAVRVIRKGEEPVILRLLTTQAYRVGRSPDSQLHFRDDCVSRRHGLLYFAPEISGWVYRDPESRTGTFIYRSGAAAEQRKVARGKPIAIVAGHILALADGENRIEFLEAVPAAINGVRAGWRSKAGQALEKSVQDAGRKTGPVVLFGPSGSGKTYLAQQIHILSGRKGSYVELNCGRLPKDSHQFQSELLGHVRGAYTGAVNRRVGALFQADGGILFLDELESLPAESQVFLLDVLEGEKELRPLGADKGQPRPNVRFIYSTKVPLDEAPLRKDLVNRLVHGHRIVIPTLAERREDIPLLVASILEDIRKAAGVEATVSPEGMDFLMAQSWPGHVRQLKELLRSTTDGHQDEPIVLDAGTFRDSLAWEDIVRRGNRKELVDPATFAAVTAVTSAAPAPASSTTVARKRPIDMTREDVERALREANSEMKRAAEILGCSPTTLREKRRKFGL